MRDQQVRRKVRHLVKIMGVNPVDKGLGMRFTRDHRIAAFDQ
jgi:hypothetical protein